MGIKTDSTGTSSTLYLDTGTPTGVWAVHHGEVDLIQSCKWCGDKNHHAYIEGACWKCWRSRNPGALQ